MSERSVLAAAIKSRAAYNTIVRYLAEDDLSAHGKIILEGVQSYYDRDAEAQSVDPELLVRTIGRSVTNPKHRETFDSLVWELAALEVSPPNVTDDVLAVKREAVGTKLATALAAGKPPDEVMPLMDEYSAFTVAIESADDTPAVVKGQSVREIAETTYAEENLIRIWPRSLNDQLDGGLIRGHHVVVFARPEAGKTLTLLNMVAGFLHQGLEVLYLGNEDPRDDIVLRIVSRLTELPKFEVLADPDRAEALAHERGYGNLAIGELAPGTPREVEALVTEWKPDVLVVDQIRNLNTGDDNQTQRLEKAATAMRNIAKKHNVLVVSATQAGDSASNKAVLEMGDVDSSNTGIPAQADVMIGVGGTAEDFAHDRRVLSLPKNKRSGSHSFFPVQLVPQLSKMRGF